MAVYSSNQHCVEKLLDLSETHSIVATQDIYDEQGFKLLAKGAEVSRDMQDRLLLRKLRAPLESSLSVRDGLTVAEILQGALDLVDQNPALESIAGSRGAREILRDGRDLHIPPPLMLLMTCVRHTSADSFRHTQVVAALCAGIAAELEASAAEARTLLVASILHDIGEIYVNPDYITRQGHLSPQEWKHVATHPRVGELLIRGLTSMPQGVLACVAQHHERHDGSGYPARLTRKEQHDLSGWMAVADSAAALINRGNSGASQVSLALRIVPKEFDRGAADVLIRGLQRLKVAPQLPPDTKCVDRAHRLLAHIETVGAALQAEAGKALSNPLLEIVGRALYLLDGFARSLRSTGILDASSLSGADASDQGLLEEMQQIVNEVTWRMRNLGRNIYLGVDACNDPAASEGMQAIIDMLETAAQPDAAAG